jgi:hypothetical protein
MLLAEVCVRERESEDHNYTVRNLSTRTLFNLRQDHDNILVRGIIERVKVVLYSN